VVIYNQLTDHTPGSPFYCNQWLISYWCETDERLDNSARDYV